MHLFERTLPLISIFVWGSAFPLITLALRGFEWTQLTVLRLGLAALAFLVLFAGGLIPFRPIARRDMGRFLLAAALAFPVGVLSLSAAQVELRPTPAAIVVQTTALFTYAIGLLSGRDAFRWSAVLGSVVAFGGAVFVLLDGSSSASWTDLFASQGLWIWLAPVSLAVYTHLTADLIPRYGSLNLTGQTITVGALVTALVCGDLGALPEAMARASSEAWIALFALALLSTVAGYLAWSRSLVNYRASQLALFLYLTPLVSAGVAVLVLGDRVSLNLIVGSAAVLGGVAWTQAALQGAKAPRLTNHR